LTTFTLTGLPPLSFASEAVPVHMPDTDA
jgi:hypothetical protein